MANLASYIATFKAFRRLRLPRRDEVLDGYYTLLYAEYERFPPGLPAEVTAVARQVKDLHDKDRLTWPKALAFERVILTLLPDAEIQARAWHLRDRYRRIVTKDQFALYEQTHDKNAKGDVLRNDMISLLVAMTEYYTVRQGIELERTGFSQRVQMFTGVLILILGLSSRGVSHLLPWFFKGPGFAALAVGAAICGLGWWTGNSGWRSGGVAIMALVSVGLVVAAIGTAGGSNNECGSTQVFTTLVMVIIAGLFGGAFSMLQRVQSPIADGDPLSNLLALRATKREIFLPPIVGAVGALVLYCLFDSQLLPNAIFPKMFEVKHSSQGSLSFLDYLDHAGPMDGIDHAKLLIWSFLAGFSERLLPDALDRLTKQASSNNGAKK
ncbi:MAG TPA: YrzE family protein [Thermoanaerobaculia bacterium]